MPQRCQQIEEKKYHFCAHKFDTNLQAHTYWRVKNHILPFKMKMQKDTIFTCRKMIFDSFKSLPFGVCSMKFKAKASFLSLAHVNNILF